MLTDLTIVQAREGLRTKQFSAVDLTMAHLHAIEALNPRLNAFITVSHAKAVDQARAADECCNHELSFSRLASVIPIGP